MSSSAGRSVSTLGGAHYTASKAGVLGLTRAMAKEVSSYGITVNAICPGLIDTEMVRKDCSTDMIKKYEAGSYSDFTFSVLENGQRYFAVLETTAAR